MSKQTIKKLVPELRFPEFRDAGEWEVKPLGKVAALITEKAGRKIYTLMSITAGLGLVTQIEKFGREIAGEAYKNYYVIKKGDFAYNKSSTKQHPEGQLALLENTDQGAVPNSIFTCFRLDEKYVSPYFLKYPFANNIHGKWLRNFIMVGARANGALNVDSKDLLALPIAIPILAEQQKIADCLSSLDELITAQTQKLDGLKTHKKGLMQQLFPAEGETLPKLRFPEFCDVGEWIESTLGEIATFAKGKGVSKAEISPTGSQPCIRYGQLYTQYKETINSVISYTDVSPSDLVLSQANDVIIPASGETQIDIATASCVLNSGIALGSDLNIIRSKMNGVFLSYYLNNAKKNAIAELAQGISVVHLYSSQLKTLKINIPDISEQQKIADCLSSIDLLIATLAQKIDALKTHKKGLMQQLFPSADEVAG